MTIPCKHCGADNLDMARLCTHCGTPMNQYDSANAPLVFDSVEPYQTGPSGFRSLLFWAAALVVIGFFLPWFSILEIISYNGWKVGDLFKQASEHGYAAGTLYSIMLYAVPIVCLALMVMNFTGSRAAIRILKFLPLAVLIAFVIIILIQSNGRPGFSREDFRYIGIGFYTTLIGIILLATSKVPVIEF